MRKINILVLPPDNFGTGNYRYIEPHIALHQYYPEYFNVTIGFIPPNWSEQSDYEEFDLIVGRDFNMELSKTKEIIDHLRSLGKKLIIDVDDYWEFPVEHPQYLYFHSLKYKERTISSIQSASYVMTTNDLLAAKIKEHNLNVIVIPNAIDVEQDRFKITHINNNRIRFGWLGGSSHLNDVQLLNDDLKVINHRYKEKIQMVLCGFNNSGIISEIDSTGKIFSKLITLLETPYYFYEKVLSSDFAFLDVDYINWLEQYKNESYPSELDKSYRRIWSQSFSEYSLNYNQFDVSLAPLANDQFNSMKSQLKVLEAGIFKKPIICSDVFPYQIDIQHGINGFLVNEKDKVKNWAYYMKKFIDYPELKYRMGQALYETVTEKYNLKIVTRKRVEFYLSIFNGFLKKY